MSGLDKFCKLAENIKKENFPFWTQLLVVIFVNHPNVEKEFVMDGNLMKYMDHGCELKCHGDVLNLLSNLDYSNYTDEHLEFLGVTVMELF